MKVNAEINSDTEMLDVISFRNGVSKSYIVYLSAIFGILFIVIILAIVFIAGFNKLHRNEENISGKNVEKNIYKPLYWSQNIKHDYPISTL